MYYCIDHTIINLVTILISGMGLYEALTKYNVPELTKSYWGENPFAVKGQKINNVMTKIFIYLAGIGLLLQAITLIFGNNIPDRRYGIYTYLFVFVVGFILLRIIVSFLTKFGKAFVRKSLLQGIVDTHKERFEKVKFIVEHGGRTDDQIERNDITEKNIGANFKETNKDLTQIERLLDIPQDKTDLKERIDRMRSYFE